MMTTNRWLNESSTEPPTTVQGRQALRPAPLRRADLGLGLRRQEFAHKVDRASVPDDWFRFGFWLLSDPAQQRATLLLAQGIGLCLRGSLAVEKLALFFQ